MREKQHSHRVIFDRLRRNQALHHKRKIATMQLPTTNTGVTADAIANLARTLESAGWEINFFDLDLSGNQPRADIRITRFDGLWLHARVDSLGRCSLEMFRRSKSLGMSANIRGRQPLSPQVNDEFLGRRRAPSPRVMLRDLCNYLVDNALNEVALIAVRNGFRGVMQAPTRLLPAAA